MSYNLEKTFKKLLLYALLGALYSKNLSHTMLRKKPKKLPHLIIFALSGEG